MLEAIGLREDSVQNRWSVLLAGSPRIYAGEGALQRSGKSPVLITRFSAGDREIPGLKRVCVNCAVPEGT